VISPFSTFSRCSLRRRPGSCWRPRWRRITTPGEPSTRRDRRLRERDRAHRVGLSAGQITSLTHGGACDPCWTDERDRLLIEAADDLHDAADIGDDLWHRLAGMFSEEQLLDLLMLAGWYHAISFTANGARVAREDGAPRFADVQSSPSR